VDLSPAEASTSQILLLSDSVLQPSNFAPNNDTDMTLAAMPLVCRHVGIGVVWSSRGQFETSLKPRPAMWVLIPNNRMSGEWTNGPQAAASPSKRPTQ